MRLRFVYCSRGSPDLDLLSQIEVVVAGSTDKIDSVLSSLPRSQDGWLKVIGVYDGDMRTRLGAKKFILPYLFLPGEFAPEHILRDALTSQPNCVEMLATELHRTREAVGPALDSVEGQDAHDWFTQLPKQIGCDHPTLMAALVRIWLGNNRGIAEIFVGSLLETMNSTG